MLLTHDVLRDAKKADPAKVDFKENSEANYWVTSNKNFPFFGFF